MENWKTIEPTVWKPVKEGDSIIGILVNKEAKDDVSGLSARYYLENSTGTYFVWGCAVLDDRMQYVKLGDKIRITYEGSTTNKRHQKVNLYRVDVADNAETKEAGSCEEPGENPGDLELEEIK